MELVRKQINGYRVLQSRVQQFEQQADIIIPDVNPDAVTVLSAWGNCTVNEQQLRKERITAGGMVDVTLLYRPENGSSAVTLKGSLGFQEVLELKGATEEDLLFLRAEIMELRGIILNSRKVGIQCRIALYAWVYQRETLLLSENVQAKPEEGVQLHVEHEQVQRMVAALEKTLTVSEEVRLKEVVDGDQLLYTALHWKAEDVRTLNKKVIVRGSVQIHTLFLHGDGSLRELDYSLPFSQIVENNDVRTDCSAELQYVTTQQQTRLERREDGIFLLCNLGARSMMEVYQECNLTTVADLYSTQYHTEIQTSSVPACGCHRTMLTSKLQENVKLEGQGARILQCHCCGATAEVNAEMLRGVFYVSVLLEDEDGCKKQLCVALREERKVEESCPGAISATVTGLTVASTGEGLCVELQVQYHLRLLKTCKKEQVEKCQLDTTRPRSGYAPGTLLLRTVGAKECTWDLAKAYGTTESAIISANHLMPDQMLEENQLVMIPFLRK